jgi:hypothetical protein
MEKKWGEWSIKCREKKNENYDVDDICVKIVWT